MATELEETLKKLADLIARQSNAGAGAAGFAGQASIVAQLLGQHRASKQYVGLPIDAEEEALRILDLGRESLGESKLLDACTDGKNLLITGTATGSANTIHTVPTNTALYDLIFLEATNNDTVARELTVEWGGVTSIGGLTYLTIPSKSGWYTVIPERRLQNGLTVKAFASAASVITVNGYVRRCKA